MLKRIIFDHYSVYVLVAVGGFIVGLVGGVVNVGLKCYVEGSFSPPVGMTKTYVTLICVYIL